jgi:hypothetical protein
MPNGPIWQAIAEGLELQLTNVFPDLPFSNGTLIPTQGGLTPGKDQVNQIFLGGASGPEAILLAPGASDIPLTPISMTTESVPVIMAAKGYDVQWQAARALSSLNIKDIVDNAKIRIVRFEIDRRLNRYAVYGEPVLKHTGLYNSPNVGFTASSFDPNTATYQQWVTFLVDMILSSGLSPDGETILEPTTVLMSQKALLRAAQVMNPINGTVSALSAVRDQLNSPDNGNLNIEFVRSPWSSAAMLELYKIFPAGNNKDRIVVYTKSDTVVLRRIEDAIAQLVDEDFLAPTQALTRIYPFFSCASSTMILNPAGVRYVDTVRAT